MSVAPSRWANTAQRSFSMRGSLGLLAAVIVVGLVFVAHALVIRTERSGDANRLLDLGEHANRVKPFS